MYGRCSSDHSRFLCGVWLSLAVSVVNICPALAQTCGGVPPSIVPAVAHPEGSAPQYDRGMDILYKPGAGDQTVYQNGNGAPRNVPVDVEYLFGGPNGTYMRSGVGGASSHPGVVYDISQGGWPIPGVDLTAPTQESMTTSAVIVIPGFVQPCGNLITADLPPYMIGLFHVAVTAADSGSVAACNVTFFNQNGDARCSVTAPASSGSVNFGQGVNRAGDSPNPAGLSGDYYQVTVSCPGYNSYTSNAILGHGYAGQSLNVTLSKTAASTGSLVSTPTGTVDTPPSTSTGSDSTADGFYTGFWDKLKQFFIDMFVPTPDSITALKTACSQLSSYGPFGLTAQIASVFGALSAANSSLANNSQDNGSYWYWYFAPPDYGTTFASQSVPGGLGLPLGYDPAKEPVHPVVATMYDSILPLYLDLSPFSDILIFVRRLMLLFGWLYFLSEMVSLLIPKPQV